MADRKWISPIAPNRSNRRSLKCARISTGLLNGHAIFLAEPNIAWERRGTSCALSWAGILTRCGAGCSMATSDANYNTKRAMTVQKVMQAASADRLAHALPASGV